MSLAQRALFIGLGALAMTAKETGVMAGLLVLTDAWIRRSRSRLLLLDTALVLALAASFAAIRVFGSFGLTAPSLSRYRVQRSVFETVGGLSVPFHADVVQQLPWLAIASVLIVIALFVTYVVASGNRSDRLVFGAGAWILISVLPVFLFVFVAPDLQGARFLYLAAPAWSSLVAALAFSTSRVVGRWSFWLVVGLGVLWGVAVKVHLTPWREAAAVRDRILTAAKSDAGLRQCQIVALKLTDNVRGAYVFRNGAGEALLSEAGLHVSDQARPECRFVWNDQTGTFSRAPE